MTTTLSPPAPATGAPPADAPAPAVAAHELVRRYGEGDGTAWALRGVSLAVDAGELVAVMGASGSGKSTLMHLLAGLDRPTAGRVWIGGAETGAMSDAALTRLRRRHVGFVFQSFNLLPALTAEQNVLLPTTIAGGRADRAWAAELLSSVGIAERRRHRPSQMSGGQQQRVAIARALVNRPTILFADEPTGNLDTASGAAVLDLLRRCVDGYGQTTVMVTHDATAAMIADRILILSDGRVVRSVRPESRAQVLRALAEVADR